MQDLGQLAPVFSKSGTSYRGKLLRDYRSSSPCTSQIEAMSRPNGHSSKVTTELNDLRLEVDERLFSWPSDYRKVEAQLIFDLIRKEGKGATPKQEEK